MIGRTTNIDSEKEELGKDIFILILKKKSEFYAEMTE